MDLFILEPITQSLAKEVVLDVHKAKASDEINVHIMSLGGDMLAGNAITAALKNSPAKVTTNVVGVAASMAAVISQAGDKRYIAEDANFNIHNGAIGNVGRGTKEEHRDAADTLEKMDNTMIKAFAKTGMNPDELHDLMKEDKLLSSEEALALGFFDGLSKPVEAVAHFNKQLNMSKLKELMGQVNTAAIKMGIRENTPEQEDAVAALETKLKAEVEEVQEQVIEEAETPAEVLGSEMVPREEFEMFKAEVLALIQPLIGAVEEVPDTEETKEIVEETTTAKLTKLMEAIKSKTVAPNAKQVFEQEPVEDKPDWSVFEAKRNEIKEANKR